MLLKELLALNEAKLPQQFTDTDEFAEFMDDHQGSAISMWMSEPSLTKLMALHNEGAKIKSVSPGEMDWHDNKDRAREKIDKLTKKWEAKGYTLFGDELGDDASEMIFVKEK